MLRPQIIESLPPHHVGAANIAWDNIPNGVSAFQTDSRRLKTGTTPVRQSVAEFLETVDADAREHFVVDVVNHDVVVWTGVRVPHSRVTKWIHKALGINIDFPGAYHIDGTSPDDDPDSIGYLASRDVATDHLAGKFFVVGAHSTLSTLLTATLLSVQAQHGLWTRADSDEIVRTHLNTSVHRSPGRNLYSDSTPPQAFIHDVIEPVTSR